MDKFIEARVNTMLSRPMKSNETFFFSPLILRDKNEQTMKYADFS